MRGNEKESAKCETPDRSAEWGNWLLSRSHGSVVSALAFQSLILSSIPGLKVVFLILSYTSGLCKLTIYNLPAETMTYTKPN